MAIRLPLQRGRVLALVLAAVLAAGCESGGQAQSGAQAEPGGQAEESPQGAVESVAATGSPGTTSVPTSPPAASQPAASQPVGSVDRIPQIVDETQPSVVSIVRQNGEGSGVVWSEDGVVVTNNHVVEGVSEVIVRFADATQSRAEVVATDPLSDLAVVRTERTGLPPAEFADSAPDVGALAIAMGNPLGFENSVTAGIVSGLHRSLPNAAEQAPALIDLIQTDAAISPGNSGGALVGADGRVMGINVAYIPPEARAVAIGFAIPATTVTDVVTELLADGRVDHAALGVRLVELTPQIAQQFGLEVTEGALVVDVVPGGPAAEAGVQAGDVIVEFDGQPVRSAEDLLAGLRRHDPGDEVTVTIHRGGQEQQVSVVLGALAG